MRFDVSIELGGTTVPMGSVDVQDRNGEVVRSAFVYDPDYLARPAKLALDPQTPLDSAAHLEQHLQRGIADAGPDGWGRRLITRANRGRALSEADLLLAVDDLARMGALRMSTEEAVGTYVAPSHDIPLLLELDDLLAAARSVETAPDDLAAIRTLLDAGSAALGGVRPKASVRDGDRLLIAKFPSAADQVDEMAWEMVCLDAAEAAGVATPARRLLAVGGARVLLLDRFDRDATGRVPYLSAFAIGTAPDPGSGDYVDIAEDLAEMDAADLSATRRELLLRAAVNVAMRNTDDHLKNHGFVWASGGWQLSPAFDITPNPVDGASRTTRIDGEDHPAREAAALVRLAREYGIPDRETRHILDRVLAASSTWRDRAAGLGIAPSEIAQFESSLSSAQRRLADVAAAL